MADSQSGILAPVPQHGRHMVFGVRPGSDPSSELLELRERQLSGELVVGIGPSAALALGRTVDGLRPFPRLVGAGIDIPSTQGALWCWLRGEDRGELLHLGRTLQRIVEPSFELTECVDLFKHGSGRDLTGYEDGTENPEGEEELAAAIVAGRGSGFDGASFVAVQQWLHDFDRFEEMAPEEQDETIGRRRSDNEELADAPSSAHVKRTAQEDFEPEAFVVRRSMPWTDGPDGGLLFLAFGRSFDAFEAQLRRMVGLDDGVTDALFRFTRPVSGSYFWCPPLIERRLDLRALGL